MYGLIIAVLVGGWALIVGGSTPEASMLQGAGFLWIWYWIWTIVQGLIVVFMMLGIAGGGAATGGQAGGLFGGLLGFAAGSIVSLFAFAMFAVGKLFLLGGTWLIMTSGTPEMVFADFDQVKLIGGGVALAIGLLMSFKVSISASSSSTTTTIKGRYRRID